MISAETKKVEIPLRLVCSITEQLFLDPVITADGHTYERELIEKWLSTQDTSPKTGEVLEHKRLITNWDKRGEVSDFLREHPEAQEERYVSEQSTIISSREIKADQIGVARVFLNRDQGVNDMPVSDLQMGTRLPVDELLEPLVALEVGSGSTNVEELSLKERSKARKKARAKAKKKAEAEAKLQEGVGTHAQLAEKTLISGSEKLAMVQNWNRTFEHLQSSEEGQRALELLKVCAYVAADNIPKELLLACLKQNHPTLKKPESYLDTMVDLLHHHSLVKKQDGTLCMHQALQTVVVHQNPLSASDYEILATICHTEFNRKTQIHENEARQKVLLPHLKNFVAHYQRSWDSKQDTTLSYATLLFDIGSISYRLGDYTAAKAAFEHTLAIQERIYGPEDAQVAITLANLGSSLVGDYARQKVLLERALAIQERVFGPEDAQVATTLMNLGNAYGDLGDYARQKVLLERALAIHERVYGPKHAQVAATLTNLGNAYGDLGDYARQKVLLKRALAIQEHVYGPKHVHVASTLGSLGGAYGSLGDYTQQKVLLERALVIFESVYGPVHVQVAMTLHNLGNAYGFLGEYAQQKVLLERALVIFEWVYGPVHAQVATTLTNLGNAYGSLGEYAQQKALLERALAIQEQAYGLWHVNVATTLTNLGGAYSSLGDYAQQKVLLERALAIQEQAYGPWHVNVASTLMNLGNAYGALGVYAQQKALLERALAIQEQVYGPKHVQVATTLMNLGIAYGPLGDYVQKKALLERALAIQEQAYGPKHVQVGITLHNLGNAYGALGECAQQKALLERALAIQEQAYGPKHVQVAIILMNLGDAHGDLGDYAQQKALLERVLPIFEKTYSSNHPNVCKVLISLSDSHKHLGNTLESQSFLKRAHAVSLACYGAEHPQTRALEKIQQGPSLPPIIFSTPTHQQGLTLERDEIALKFRRDSENPKVAADRHYSELVKKAISLKVHLEKSSNGNTALHWALIRNQAEKIILLLRELEKTDQEAIKLLAIKNNEGKTALDIFNELRSLLPDEIRKLIQKILAYHPQGISTIDALLTMKQPLVPQAGLGQLQVFLNHVVAGEQTQAEKLLKKNRDLVLFPGNVTDLSGRTFENITGFQYAVWALDRHMWTMLRRYLPDAAAEQLRFTGPWVSVHGLHAGIPGGPLDNLQNAYQAYMKDESTTTWKQVGVKDESITTWQKQVGGAQLLLPAHVINEYCRSDRSFYPCPNFEELTLPRTRTLAEGEWFTAVYNGGKLGDKFGIFRGTVTCGDASVAVASAASGMGDVSRLSVYFDHAAVVSLTKARTQQRDQLVSALRLDQQVTPARHAAGVGL